VHDCRASFETRPLVLESRCRRRLEGGAPQDEASLWWGLRKVLILRKPQSGCLEGRTALLQLNFNSFTPAFAGMTSWEHNALILARSISGPAL